jgi:hypothetical protein
LEMMQIIEIVTGAVAFAAVVFLLCYAALVL